MGWDSRFVYVCRRTQKRKLNSQVAGAFNSRTYKVVNNRRVLFQAKRFWLFSQKLSAITLVAHEDSHHLKIALNLPSRSQDIPGKSQQHWIKMLFKSCEKPMPTYMSSFAVPCNPIEMLW